MARRKEFDEEEVLEKAMATFWRYGYEGTSIQNLVDSMGINRGSLYDTFGDKKSLFKLAIAYYNETILKKLLATLETSGAAKQAIKDCFYSLVEGSLADRDRKGCLITNTAVELCPHDRETNQTISANFKRLENAFQAALITAQQQGEISGDRDIEAIASFLTSSLQGLRVVAKVNPNSQMLRNIVKLTLSVLD